MEARTPALIPITDCKAIGAYIFKDEELMSEFVCEIWDSKKNPIARKKCAFGGAGVSIHLYDNEYYKKSDVDSTMNKKSKK